MLKRKNTFLIIILFNILLLNISSNYNYKDLIKSNNNNSYEFGRIIINKININNKLFEIESEENQIDKNITILKESTTPDNDDSIMLIAAHSGNNEVSYFERLDELELNDEVILIYKSKKYYYYVNDILEQKKNGYININKESKKQLVLTTCSPNKDNIQLIVICTEKESN